MIFRILTKNVPNVSKAAFYLSGPTICHKKCFGGKQINTFGFSGKKSQNFNGQVSRRNFWGNKLCIKEVIQIIFWIWERKFQTFSKNIQQSCQKGILRDQRMNFRKKKLLEVYSSLIFSDTEQKLSDFMRTVLCRIINYAFYAPKGSFWENFLFEIYASHSRISNENRCQFIAQNFSVGLSNLNPKCPDDPLLENNLLEFLSISVFFDYEQ